MCLINFAHCSLRFNCFMTSSASIFSLPLGRPLLYSGGISANRLASCGRKMFRHVVEKCSWQEQPAGCRRRPGGYKSSAAATMGLSNWLVPALVGVAAAAYLALQRALRWRRAQHLAALHAEDASVKILLHIYGTVWPRVWPVLLLEALWIAC